MSIVRVGKGVWLLGVVLLALLLVHCASASAKTAQQITLSPSRSATVGAILEVTPAASSREPVSLSSATPGVCSLSPRAGPPSHGVLIGVVHTLAVGTCTIVARQEGSSTYEAAEARQSFTIVALTSAANFGFAGSHVEAGTGVVKAEARFGSPGALVWKLTYTGKSGATEVFGEGQIAVPGQGLDTFTVTPSASAVVEMDRVKETGLPVRVLLTFECKLEGCPITREWAITASNAPEPPAIDRELTLEKLDEISLRNASGATLTGIEAVLSAGYYDVVLHGQGLRPSIFSPPAGYTGPEPTGAVKVLTISALTGFVTEESCCSKESSLTGFGPVIKLAISDALKITFISSAPQAAMVGGADYRVSATSAAGLPVSFSSPTPTVCGLSAAKVSFIATGTCTIDATVVDQSTGETNESRQFFDVGAQIVKLLGSPNVAERRGAIELDTAVQQPGQLAWKLTFAHRSHGKTTTEVFGEGATTVTGSSTPRLTVKTSAPALRALGRARKQRQGLAVNVTLTFSEAPEGLPVAVERTIGVREKAG